MKTKKPTKAYVDLQDEYRKLCGHEMPDGIVPYDIRYTSRSHHVKHRMLCQYFTHVPPPESVKPFQRWSEIEPTLKDATHQQKLEVFCDWCRRVFPKHAERVVRVKKRKPRWTDGLERAWMLKVKDPENEKGSRKRKPYRKRERAL